MLRERFNNLFVEGVAEVLHHLLFPMVTDSASYVLLDSSLSLQVANRNIVWICIKKILFILLCYRLRQPNSVCVYMCTQV